MEGFVEYYERLKISPVSQDISDLSRHFGRRNGLYRNLGIPPGLVKGRSVIEFGPGSGYNSIHTASLGPSDYVLVDGNSTGIAKLNSLFADHCVACADVVQSMIEDFESEKRFDLVICEGTIPFQADPSDIFNHVSSFTAPGGLLVVTCIDAVSYFPECLRRFFARMVVSQDDPIESHVAELVEMLGSHLNTLEGMTRPHHDWVLDNIVQPFSGRELFGIRDVADAVNGLSFYSSSPQVSADWRWYKQMGDNPDETFTNYFLERYWENLHRFMDYRLDDFSIGDSRANKELLEKCGKCYEIVVQAESAEGDLPGYAKDVISLVDDVIAIIGRYQMGGTVSALQSYVKALRDAIKGIEAGSGLHDLTKIDCGEFAGLFGRGQQYVSLIRDWKMDQ